MASTNDGGANFGPLARVATCGDAAESRDLAFDDHGDGFLYGPSLFATHDGGQSWTPVAHSGTVLSVAALGDSIWMVEAGCGLSGSTPRPDSCPLTVLASVDGGRNFIPTGAQPPNASVYAGAVTLERAQGQSWLVRTGVASAYLISTPIPNQSGQPDSAPLWFTDDGGYSWTARTVPCGLNALSVTLSAASDGSLMAVCAGQPSAGAQFKSLSASTDGGNSWSIKGPCVGGPGTIQTSSCLTSPLSHGYLGEIDAVSSSTVYLVGGRSPLLVTRDGGATWEPVGTISSDGGEPAQVASFDSENGVVISNPGGQIEPTVWHTDNGAETWSPVTPSG